jgi:PKD repeat protein
MSTCIRKKSTRPLSPVVPVSASWQIAVGVFALAIAVLPLGCSTDPGVTDPVAALFEGVLLTTSKGFVPNGGGQAELTAQVVSKSGQPLRGVRVVFETTAGEFLTGAEAATDESGTARTTLQTGDRAVVRARVGEMQSGATMVDIDSPVTIDIDAASKVFEGQTAQVEVSAKRKDGHAVTGELTVDWGDGKSSTLEGFTKSATVGHRYSKTGSFELEAEITQTAGQKDTSSSDIRVEESVDIEVDITANALFAEVNNRVTFTVTATREDGKPGLGRVLIDFGDGEVDERTNFDGRTNFNHRFEEEGEYRVKATLSASNGADDSASVAIEVGESAVTVAGNDELDLGQVSFLHANISRWPATSTITDVRITGSQVCVYHTKAGKWPVKSLSGVAVEGNPWVVVNRDGRWYAGTYEWLRPGQICKGITAGNIGGHIKQAPLANWRPRSGEQVGFIVSTLARDANRTSNERTNVKLVRWP